MLKAHSKKKSFGKLPILKGVDLDVNAGEIASILVLKEASEIPKLFY